METKDPKTMPEKKLRTGRLLLIALAAIGLGVLSFFAFRNDPVSLQASLTGGSSSDSTVDEHLYIPTDYKAEAGDTGYISVKAGETLTKLNGLEVVIYASASQLTLPASISTSGTELDGISSTVTSATGKITVDFGTFTEISSVSDDATLFKLNVAIDSDVDKGDTIPISFDTTNSSITLDTTTSSPTASDGKISISATEECATLDCGSYGYCKSDACICDTGYTGTRCTVCDTGYSGYPTCAKVSLGNLEGVVLTLSKDSISKLSSAEKLKAYSSVYLLINASTAAGSSIYLESTSVTIPTGTGTTEADKINSIVDSLETTLEGVTGVNATQYTEIPGLIKIEAVTGNTDSSMSGIYATSGEVEIVPGMDYTLELHPTSVYKTRVLGKNNDGSMMELNYDDVDWLPQPTDRLSSTALAGGLLEKGTKSGTTPLYVQVAMDSGLWINSVNQLSIYVPSEPIIEYLHRIGSKAIERGGRINLNMKISDSEQISDISDIVVSIVKSSYTTYSGIKTDTDAVWFTATAFPDEITTTDSSTSSSGSTSTSSTSTSSTSTSSTDSTTTGTYYKIYNIPIEVPQDLNLVNGSYKLVLEITDTAGHTAASVMSVAIGAASTGDVNADGQVTMLDVILAFQFTTSGSLTPTQAQKNSADMDNDGAVTMLDVIILFNKL